MRILRGAPRLRTYSWIRELLSRAEESWFHDPDLAEETTELALLASDYLDSRTLGRSVLEDLRAEIWAYLANSRRIRSDHRGAVDAFARAEEHQRRGTGDAAELARVAGLYSTFLRDSEDFDVARDHLDHAISLYRYIGSRHLEARALISKWIIEWFDGDYDLAMSLLDRATRWIEPGRDPRLAGALAKNRALTVAELGDRAAILRSLRGLEASGACGQLDRLRTTWARGRLLERLEQPERAERVFLAARRGFVQARIPIDIALLDLDLGRLYATLGRIGEAKLKASAAFPVFASRGLHRETLRSLDLFRRAGGVA